MSEEVKSCRGYFTVITYNSDSYNQNVIKSIDNKYCVQRNDCALYKEENRRRLVKPTLSMVASGSCSEFIEIADAPTIADYILYTRSGSY